MIAFKSSDSLENLAQGTWGFQISAELISCKQSFRRAKVVMSTHSVYKSKAVVDTGPAVPNVCREAI